MLKKRTSVSGHDRLVRDEISATITPRIPTFQGKRCLSKWHFSLRTKELYQQTRSIAGASSYYKQRKSRDETTVKESRENPKRNTSCQSVMATRNAPVRSDEQSKGKQCNERMRQEIGTERDSKGNPSTRLQQPIW